MRYVFDLVSCFDCDRNQAHIVHAFPILLTGTPVQTSLTDLRNQLKFLGLECVDEMFQTFGGTLRHTNDRAAKALSNRRRRRRFGVDADDESSVDHLFGHFLFLMKTLLIRHAQQQTYRGTPTRTTLMSLPPKTDRLVEIEFSEQERREYKSLEDEALSYYRAFKSKLKGKLGKHFLKLTAKLAPVRVACAGGHVPLDDVTDEGEEENRDDAEDEEADSKNKRKVKFTKFAFKAKFNKLIEELKHARDNDPTSKSLVFSQWTSSLEYLKVELPKHGFSFRTLSGDMPMRKRAQALHDFQHDPPTTIFLLSMRAGAVGGC